MRYIAPITFVTLGYLLHINLTPTVSLLILGLILPPTLVLVFIENFIKLFVTSGAGQNTFHPKFKNLFLFTMYYMAGVVIGEIAKNQELRSTIISLFTP